MSSIDERLDAPESEPWMPEPGDSTAGRVLEVSERTNEFNPAGYPIVTLDAGGRIVDVHAFHEVLANEFARLEVRVGDNIGVKYLGRKGGDGYYRYKVVKDGPMPEFSWAKYKGPDEPGPSPDESQFAGDDETAF